MQAYSKHFGTNTILCVVVALVRACARGGNPKRALSLLQVVKDKGLPLDSYCYTAVIDGKCDFLVFMDYVRNSLTSFNLQNLPSLRQRRHVATSTFVTGRNASERYCALRSDI